MATRDSGKRDSPLLIMATRDSGKRACVTLMFFIITFILLVAQAAVGGKYLNDCPKQPFIPIYLLVMGGGILVFCCEKMCSMFIAFFFFIWFLAGNACIFAIYKPNFETHGDDYCNKTLYLFAFGSTIFTYVMLVAFAVCWYCEEQESGHDVSVPYGSV